MSEKIYLTALDKEGYTLAEISFLEKYLHNRRWDVLSAAIRQLFKEVQRHGNDCWVHDISVAGPKKESSIPKTDFGLAFLHIKTAFRLVVNAFVKLSLRTTNSTPS